ncbi:fatty acyl-CoA reductase wat-like isoform X3 [Belonocnema kinseyi]|uniref:fatty acyl-CoA reductase wat-like isoform X3 n=1 Tax=Belonocnema kinseyi TaxID=2817044 RepID=UPI00143D0941|nr:fatty acyl-CoA reductase wat-like isoform X3 [Belonocnema kinseyi]
MPDVRQFYEGENVFITGGTGFMGKILIEKLLRYCPEIGNIYLLMRIKKGKPTHERLSEIATLPMFDPLRKINPDFQTKLVPISGDASKPGLGLSSEDRSIITTEAAVYVSTAFSQCVHVHENIEEKVYPISMTYEEINNTVQIMKRRNFSEKDEVQFTRILLGEFPNTYVFTKSIAEGVLNEQARDLPFSIFRFPIAIATYKEPVPGWVDTVQGFNQAIIGIGIGVIRVLNIDINAHAHMVPADFACNALIATAWETSTFENRDNPEELPVYNYVSDECNILTWNSLRKMMQNRRYAYLPMKTIYFPDSFVIKSTKVFAFAHFILHLIPALLGDVVLRILGKPPILYKVYKKGNKLLRVTRFFLLWNWTFESKKVQSLWKKLSKADKELIPFDLTTIDWEDVATKHWNGTLKYALRDFATTEERMRKSNRLRRIHRTVQVLSATFMIWVLWKLYLALFEV